MSTTVVTVEDLSKKKNGSCYVRCPECHAILNSDRYVLKISDGKDSNSHDDQVCSTGEFYVAQQQETCCGEKRIIQAFSTKEEAEAAQEMIAMTLERPNWKSELCLVVASPVVDAA